MIEEIAPYSGTVPVASLASVGGGTTLVEGQCFALSTSAGNMIADHPYGLFFLDTRYLSHWELRLNDHPLDPLTVATQEPFAATFVARGAPARGRADADLVVFRHRHIGRGMRERIVVTNHGLDPVVCTLELECDCDFASLFAVKEGRVGRSGWHRHDVDEHTLRYAVQEPMRQSTTIVLSHPAVVRGGSALWTFRLAAGASFEVCIEVRLGVDDEVIEPRFRCDVDDADAVPSQRLSRWRATMPLIRSDHRPFDAVVQRSGSDLGALRIFDPEHPDVPILAAGAPWFMTVFGRDSLLTGWMTLLADATLARGVLQTLARFQGDDVDPTSEQEPGRILHEMRFGSTGGQSLADTQIYYGSIDATPLFVMLLGELRRWDHQDPTVEELLPHADRALAWITDFGDRDGDGYVEYQRASPDGLANQGWKDSWDAVRFADGTLADAPIALCEVQGYVHAAYVARAHLAIEAGDDATAHKWATRARELRERFNEDFWLEREGTFALGLDRNKRPIDAVTSNVGHCLWTGIVDEERAALVAQRLMHDDMFSGFGVRTLASSMRAFNPVSYHNGSIWPHDNAICAAGLARYGHMEAAHRIITAQLDVTASSSGSLPELFAGFDRGHLATPAQYPTSCSPQAWAAAAPLLWLRTMLRLDPSAPTGKLWLAPELAAWLGELHVQDFKVGGRSISVDVDATGVSVTGADGLEVIAAPRAAVAPTIGGLDP